MSLSKNDIDAFFDNRYGTDFTKLEKWQMLCVDVGVEPVPPSKTKCRKVSICLQSSAKALMLIA